MTTELNQKRAEITVFPKVNVDPKRVKDLAKRIADILPLAQRKIVEEAFSLKFKIS